MDLVPPGCGERCSVIHHLLGWQCVLPVHSGHKNHRFREVSP